jgi:hypothetical protein
MSLASVAASTETPAAALVMLVCGCCGAVAVRRAFLRFFTLSDTCFLFGGRMSAFSHLSCAAKTS